MALSDQMYMNYNINKWRERMKQKEKLNNGWNLHTSERQQFVTAES